jgi:hypothetical protein
VRHGWRLEDAWQQARVDGCLSGPATTGVVDVEHQRAGCIGDVGCVLAAHAETDAILGQEDVPHPGPEFRFVCADPEQLGESEIGERRVRRELEEPVRSNRGLEPAALLFGPLIAPDDGRPYHFTGCVQQHGAVHLSRQSDRADAAARHAAVARAKPLPQHARHQSAGSCLARSRRWNSACSAEPSRRPAQLSARARDPLVPTADANHASAIRPYFADVTHLPVAAHSVPAAA